MKPKVSIPLDEQELHINFSPVEMGKQCEVYTTIPYMMKYLEKMVTNYPEQCTLVKDDQYSYTAMVPFKLVKPRNPRKEMTDDEKDILRERLAQMRTK